MSDLEGLKAFQIMLLFQRKSYKQTNSSFEIQKILHLMSISSPSLLHRNDGLDMELIWSNDGVSSKEERKNNGVSCK